MAEAMARSPGEKEYKRRILAIKEAQPSPIERKEMLFPKILTWAFLERSLSDASKGCPY